MSDLAAPPLSNIPEYTVAEISGAVKRTLEGAFGRVRVRGEITELKRYPSGHIYFSLKDEGGKLSGIVWKGSASRLGLAPENGLEVIASGKLTAYGERSSYQLIVDRMEYAGEGAMLARIERLRLRLAEEGLFDAARKQRLPLLPAVIGVVTSAQGAVLQDIRTTVARRFARPILLWPVPVQGPDAAARIAAAIAGFDAMQPGGAIPRPDVLIVARGGGSLEDLMAFNDEAVVRAAAACRIPLISAVGHETDTTLIDFASARRAPTPTAAAELAVPSRVELVATLAGEAARLASALHRVAQERRLRLGRAERGLPDLPGLVGAARQRLDDRAARLALALPNLLSARRAALARAERNLPGSATLLRAARQASEARGFRLALAMPGLLAARRAALVQARLQTPDPRGLMMRPHQALEVRGARLDAGLRRAVDLKRSGGGRVLARLNPAPLAAGLREGRARLEGLAARLASVGHEAVLARGYALVLDAAGATVTHAAAVRGGARLRLRFADGQAAVTADPAS